MIHQNLDFNGNIFEPVSVKQETSKDLNIKLVPFLEFYISVLALSLKKLSERTPNVIILNAIYEGYVIVLKMIENLFLILRQYISG